MQVWKSLQYSRYSSTELFCSHKCNFKLNHPDLSKGVGSRKTIQADLEGGRSTTCCPNFCGLERFLTWDNSQCCCHLPQDGAMDSSLLLHFYSTNCYPQDIMHWLMMFIRYILYCLMNNHHQQNALEFCEHHIRHWREWE